MRPANRFHQCRIRPTAFLAEASFNSFQPTTTTAMRESCPLSLPKTPSALARVAGSASLNCNHRVLELFVHVLVSLFKTQAPLEAEIVILRHQLNLLRRRVRSKPRLTVGPALRLRPRRHLQRLQRPATPHLTCHPPPLPCGGSSRLEHRNHFGLGHTTAHKLRPVGVNVSKLGRAIPLSVNSRALRTNRKHG